MTASLTRFRGETVGADELRSNQRRHRAPVSKVWCRVLPSGAAPGGELLVLVDRIVAERLGRDLGLVDRLIVELRLGVDQITVD